MPGAERPGRLSGESLSKHSGCAENVSEQDKNSAFAILLIESDESQREPIAAALRAAPSLRCGKVVTAADAAQCLREDLSAFDVVLVGIEPEDARGTTLLRELLKRSEAPVIVLTSESDLEAAAKAMRRGAAAHVVKVGDFLSALPVIVARCIEQYRMKEDNKHLRAELDSALSELKTKNMQLRESLGSLQKMAATDHLTGLANRRHFKELLEKSYSEAVRYGFDLTCCMCDLDNFKRANDELGHVVGDMLLIMAAEVISSSLRSSDVAARYGGDEFVVLLTHTPVDQGVAVGERIRRKLADATGRCEDIPEPVTLSIGVASLNADRPDDPEGLIVMADRALYVAKSHGKDVVVAFGDSGPVEAKR